MEHGIKIELVETGEVFNLTHSQRVLLTGYTVSTPDPKEYTVDIDGRDGEIDFTGLFGTVKFKNRTVTATLNIGKIGNLTEQSVYHNRLMMKLHGQLVNITHWQRPDCYYQGRCKVGDMKNSVFSLTINANPYAFKNNLTYFSYDFSPTKNLVEMLNNDNADTTKRWTSTYTAEAFQTINNGVAEFKKAEASAKSPIFSVAGLNKLSFSCKTPSETLRVRLIKYNASNAETSEYIELINGKYENWAVPTGITKMCVLILPRSSSNFPVFVSNFQVEAGASCTEYSPKGGVLVVNNGKPVTPEFITTAETTITIGALTATMSQGTHKYNLTIPNGETVVTATGSGTLSIRFQERLL